MILIKFWYNNNFKSYLILKKFFCSVSSLLQNWDWAWFSASLCWHGLQLRKQWSEEQSQRAALIPRGPASMDSMDLTYFIRLFGFRPWASCSCESQTQNTNVNAIYQTHYWDAYCLGLVWFWFSSFKTCVKIYIYIYDFKT